MLSNAPDLERFMTGLLRGRLLKPAQQRQLFVLPALSGGTPHGRPLAPSGKQGPRVDAAAHRGPGRCGALTWLRDRGYGEGVPVEGSVA